MVPLLRNLRAPVVRRQKGMAHSLKMHRPLRFDPQFSEWGRVHPLLERMIFLLSWFAGVTDF